jgi:hypothetical protein
LGACWFDKLWSPRYTTLTDTAIRNAKPIDKPYKLSDAQGLYLLIKPNGSKLWQLKYRFGGKEKKLAFGAYPTVTLANARKLREEARAVLSAGDDPGKKQQEKQAKKSGNTFEEVARKWLAGNIRWSERMQQSPALAGAARIPADGQIPVADLKTADLLIPLRVAERKAIWRPPRADTAAHHGDHALCGAGEPDRQQSGQRSYWCHRAAAEKPLPRPAAGENAGACWSAGELFRQAVTRLAVQQPADLHSLQ